MKAKTFDEDGILLIQGVPWQMGIGIPDSPVPGTFVSAHMLFGPASIIQKVRYDPNLYFFGEEISLAVRLWTSAYDIYHPNKLVLFHNWDRSGRRTHFDDHSKWYEYHFRAVDRLRRILKIGGDNSASDAREIEPYGLGTVRTLEQFQHFSGVDFSKLTFVGSE
jgi:hypothetical protein